MKILHTKDDCGRDLAINIDAIAYVSPFMRSETAADGSRKITRDHCLVQLNTGALLEIAENYDSFVGKL